MNAASTPAFRAIMKRLARQGKRGGPLMRQTWAEYKRHHKTVGRNPRKKRVKAICKHCGGLMTGSTCLNCLRQNPSNNHCGKCGTYTKSSKMMWKDGKLYPVCRKCKAPKKLRRNPIAVYNPQNKTTLPMSIVEIRYRRTGGGYGGQFFKHKFAAGNIKVFGLPDGSLLVRGNKRLWGTAE